MSALASAEPVVFVVDDSVDVREGLQALLESVGLRCQAFGSPAEFFSRAPDAGPNCLILDVRLPEMSGLEVQAELARDSRNIPTIIITGHGDIPMSVRAMKAGAVEFLTKPVREQDLLDAVRVAHDRDRERRRSHGQIAALRSRFDTLTAREREVVKLVTLGRM